jgi:hypothetical protein
MKGNNIKYFIELKIEKIQDNTYELINLLF